MSVLQEQVKRFSELPSLKMQIEDLKLKLESLEKIKSTISSDNYSTLSNSYYKQISELAPKIELLQPELTALKSEVDLDSKVLEGENSLVEKELLELQFLSEQGALSKQDYDRKRSTIQQKLSKNRNLLSKNQSATKELDFYGTYVGIESYTKHSYNSQIGTIKEKISGSGNFINGLIKNVPSLIKSRVFLSIFSVLVILLIISKLFGSNGSVKIGNQIWKTKNLDVDHYLNGDPIPQVQDEHMWANLESGAWCYYENNSEYGKTYGKLYNWYAINDSRGLAPKGWHVATNNDWTSLEDQLGEKNIAGGKLKESGTTHWENPNINATNEIGFSALPGGYRTDDGIFNYLRTDGNWWSSTEFSSINAYYYGLYNVNAYIDKGKSNKKVGFSVRCVRNY